MAYVPVALAISDQFRDHDLRVYALLDLRGIGTDWIKVNQTQLAQELSAGGRLISRQTVMRSLKRLTRERVLAQSGRLYHAITATAWDG